LSYDLIPLLSLIFSALILTINVIGGLYKTKNGSNEENDEDLYEELLPESLLSDINDKSKVNKNS